MVSVKKVSMFIMAAIMGNVLNAQNSEATAGQTQKSAIKSAKGAKSATEKKIQMSTEEQMDQLHSNGEKKPRNVSKLEAITEQMVEKENGAESEAQPLIDDNAASKVEKQKSDAVERKQQERPATPATNQQVTTNGVKKISTTTKTVKTKLKSGSKKKKGKVKKAIKAAKRK